MKLIFYILLLLSILILTNEENINMNTWTQKKITLNPKRRGCYLVTDEVLSHIRSELSEYKCGVYIKNVLIIFISIYRLLNHKKKKNGKDIFKNY